jgi:hypothetical protein
VIDHTGYTHVHWDTPQRRSEAFGTCADYLAYVIETSFHTDALGAFLIAVMLFAILLAMVLIRQNQQDLPSHNFNNIAYFLRAAPTL